MHAFRSASKASSESVFSQYTIANTLHNVYIYHMLIVKWFTFAEKSVHWKSRFETLQVFRMWNPSFQIAESKFSLCGIQVFRMWNTSFQHVESKFSECGIQVFRM